MKKSAGILLFKRDKDKVWYFLVHSGGPFWKNKDLGAWSVPKGEIMDGEDALERAKIEFQEETGQTVEGEFIPLSSIQQKGGKIVHAWAVEGDIDLGSLSSNTFDLEWPPKSGKIIKVPEVDQWEWFTFQEARTKINSAQIAFLLEVQKRLEINK
ncbi:NUDIX domain-containing protein [Chryseobacterium daecheongense]|uniref:NUDIX domain-containing protein n=1 Tax=Chryseobacterium daecheongense TaxID=192389 RepID=A0A3N0W3K4_9FLAO|nr:NUDIX domain-containing protein [Chryseobacterium daecheongense]ROH99641.1 NUDIX domain-containing protein [Chryseobacterium daecheongense]TDX95445.1 putative NUDIX family NTP pyrophosphohydrolase [Chryseobacterium daecheongense]